MRLNPPSGLRGRRATDAYLPDLLARTRSPVLVVDLDSGRIVWASDVVTRSAWLGPAVVGLHWGDIVDGASDDLDLVRRGRLTGFEALRDVRPPDGRPRSMLVWVRALESTEPVRHATALFAPNDDGAVATAAASGRVGWPVVGTAGHDLVVDHVSTGVASATGYEPDQMVGRSLLELVAPQDVHPLVTAHRQLTNGQRAASTQIRLRNRESAVTVECLLMPMQPEGCIAFVLLRVPPASDAGVDVSVLSPREREIVARLQQGDRVPVIARSMLLSQSTIRSHLSAVFAKFGVRSQQELITKLRGTD